MRTSPLSGTTVVIAVTVLTIAGAVLAVLGGDDKTGTILGFFGPTIAALLVLLKVHGVQGEVREVKTQINGRMDAHADAAARGAAVVGREAIARFVHELGELETAAAHAATDAAVKKSAAQRHPASPTAQRKAGRK